MSIQNILTAIDAEIARLTQARKLLANSSDIVAASKVGSSARASLPTKKQKKRVLSPEARKRIADAQRKRWAAQRAKTK